MKLQLAITQIVFKGGFFSESAIRFSDLQISKKNIQKNFITLSEKKTPLEASKELGKHFVRFVDDWRTWCFSVEIYRSLERPWTSFLS